MSRGDPVPRPIEYLKERTRSDYDLDASGVEFLRKRRAPNYWGDWTGKTGQMFGKIGSVIASAIEQSFGNDDFVSRDTGADYTVLDDIIRLRRVLEGMEVGGKKHGQVSGGSIWDRFESTYSGM